MHNGYLFFYQHHLAATTTTRNSKNASPILRYDERPPLPPLIFASLQMTELCGQHRKKHADINKHSVAEMQISWYNLIGKFNKQFESRQTVSD
jgi:hypothetical protein